MLFNQVNKKSKKPTSSFNNRMEISIFDISVSCFQEHDVNILLLKINMFSLSFHVCKIFIRYQDFIRFLDKVDHHLEDLLNDFQLSFCQTNDNIEVLTG